MKTLYKIASINSRYATKIFGIRKLATLGYLLIFSFVGYAQTPITAPVSLTYTSTATLPACGSNGTGTTYSAVTSAPDGGRAAAMNDGGFSINIPNVTSWSDYGTKCLYWGVSSTIGGFNISTSQSNNFNTPSIGGTGNNTLTVTGSTTLYYYNAAIF